MIGKVPSIYNDKVIYLKIRDHYSSNKYEKTDSVIIKNNLFFFDGVIKKECELAYLSIKDNSAKLYLQILVDSGENIVTILKVMGEDYYQNKLHNLKIASSPSNDLFLKKDSLENKFRQSYGVPDAANGTVIQLSTDRKTELEHLKLELIKQNFDNFYSLIYLRDFLNFNGKEFMVLDAYQVLGQHLKNSELGIDLKNELTSRIKSINKVKIGSTVPEFSVSTFEGNNFKNNDLDGSPYLIVFSATWCIPCQEQLPTLINFYNRYKDKGLKVVYFNLDTNVRIWKEHIKKNNLSWINVSERTKFKDSDIAKQFHIYAIPSSFLIDRKGKIKYNSDTMDVEMNELENYIKQVL
ncbi:MAG: TlpA disulfide reductase family protein [Bacteroidota bacterium]